VWLVVSVQEQPGADRTPALLAAKLPQHRQVDRRGALRRRRVAQYWLRVGSSGDAAPLTRSCRTILVQANRCR
jgi:hypothetical protein